MQYTGIALLDWVPADRRCRGGDLRTREVLRCAQDVRLGHAQSMAIPPLPGRRVSGRRPRRIPAHTTPCPHRRRTTLLSVPHSSWAINPIRIWVVSTRP